ncbi:MAG: hypothetical protein AB1489_11990 [Acidobacteriota bacterium]
MSNMEHPQQYCFDINIPPYKKLLREFNISLSKASLFALAVFFPISIYAAITVGSFSILINTPFPYPHPYGMEKLVGGAIMLGLMLSFTVVSGFLLTAARGNLLAVSDKSNWVRLTIEMILILIAQSIIWFKIHYGGLLAQLLDTWWHYFIPQAGGLVMLTLLLLVAGRAKLVQIIGN